MIEGMAGLMLIIFIDDDFFVFFSGSLYDDGFIFPRDDVGDGTKRRDGRVERVFDFVVDASVDVE